jgi:small subunit ribosomal protein S3
MAQKVHPIGFRNGITKKYNSIWFANGADYAKFLEEDYRIRYVLERFFRSLFVRVKGEARFGHRRSRSLSRSVFEAGGITKFEIRRKGTLLEVLIHAGYPHYLENFPGWYKSLVEDKFIFIRHATKVSIKLIRVKNPTGDGSLVARSICDQLERRLSFRRVLRSVSGQLRKANVEGFKIKVSGRLGGVEMARSLCVGGGRVPLSTLEADITYSFQEALTKYGIIGVKVWICNKVNV